MSLKTTWVECGILLHFVMRLGEGVVFDYMQPPCFPVGQSNPMWRSPEEFFLHGFITSEYNWTQISIPFVLEKSSLKLFLPWRNSWTLFFQYFAFPNWRISKGDFISSHNLVFHCTIFFSSNQHSDFLDSIKSQHRKYVSEKGKQKTKTIESVLYYGNNKFGICPSLSNLLLNTKSC